MLLPRFALASLLSVSIVSHAADAPARVEIKAPDDAARARDATVGRQVVGRADIAAYGDSNLADVLGRQSGVAIVGGEVRMRGLGAGYTRILIDGAPVPQGFAIDSIAPSLVERIEIVRSATVDQSTGAVAGSINIVLRRRTDSGQREATAALGVQHGYASPSLSTQVGTRSGALAWSLGATLERFNPLESVRIGSALSAPDGAPVALRHSVLKGRAEVDRLNLAPRLNWSFDGGDTLSWHTLAIATRAAGRNRLDESTLFGSSTAYPHSGARLDADTANLRSELAWAGRIQGGKLTVTGLVDGQHRRSDYLFEGQPLAAAAPLFQRRVSAGIDERQAAIKGKYLLPLRAAHSLALGWDGGRTVRDEFRHQHDSLGEVRDSAPPLLQDYRAIVRRLALFAQDEWEMSERAQLYLGVRWEGLRTATVGADIAAVRSSQSVLSPVAQLLYKLDGRQQVRLALARTYKAPPVLDLVPRRYTINNDNSAVNADFEGNPGLRPELAWGLDSAYERPLGKDGMASISGYLRHVSDVTAQRLYRDGTSWVTRPVNDGKARVAGIEVDLKAPVSMGTSTVDVRMNLSRHWSRVERVPGPDNRLADQVPLTANLGADYRAGAGWTGGANLTYQAAGTSVNASGVRETRGAQTLLDLNWSRNLDDGWQLRVAAVNALGRGRTGATVYQGAEDRQVRSVQFDAFATVRASLRRSW